MNRTPPRGEQLLMSSAQQRLEERALRRLSHVKSSSPVPIETIGPALVNFFKQSVVKQTKLGRIAHCWDALVPELLRQRCALDTFSRGTLTVLVDSASHLYELKHLLLSGLEEQLLLAGSSAGLRKVVLRAGRLEASGSPPTESPPSRRAPRR